MNYASIKLTEEDIKRGYVRRNTKAKDRKMGNYDEDIIIDCDAITGIKAKYTSPLKYLSKMTTNILCKKCYSVAIMSGHFDCLVHFSKNREIYNVTQEAFVEAIKQNNLIMLEYLCKTFRHRRTDTREIYEYLGSCPETTANRQHPPFRVNNQVYETETGISYYHPKYKDAVNILNRYGFYDTITFSGIIYDNNMEELMRMVSAGAQICQAHILKAIRYKRIEMVKYMLDNCTTPLKYLTIMERAVQYEDIDLVRVCREHFNDTQMTREIFTRRDVVSSYLRSSKCNMCHMCIPRIETTKMCDCGGEFRNCVRIDKDWEEREKIRTNGLCVIPSTAGVHSEIYVRVKYLEGHVFSSDLLNSKLPKQLIEEMFRDSIEITNEEIIRSDIESRYGCVDIDVYNRLRASYTKKWYAKPLNKK